MASIEIANVQRVRVWSETTFATDGTGTLGNFTDVPIREGSAQIVLTTDSLDPQQMVQSRAEYREEVLGKKSATMALTLNLSPTGTAASTSTQAVTSALGVILKAVMGGEFLGQGSTSSTGSSATVVNVQSGHGSRFSVGGLLGWANSSGIVEWREIESISTDAITLKHALSGSPANTNAIYSAATYYITENPSESLQFFVQTYDNDEIDQVTLLGGQCVGGMQIAIDPTGAQLPSVTFNFTFANYIVGDSNAGGNVAIGVASYSAYSPIVGHAGEFRAWTVGASTLSTSTRVHVSALAFNPAVSFVPVTSPSGTNTILRWRGGRLSPPAEGSFTTYFDGWDWWTARDNKADRAIQYTMGTAAGSSVVLTAPTVQIVNPQRAADASQLAAQTIAWKARRDSDVGSSTSDIARSPFRIHIC